jgi:hypothetical protein
VQHNNGEMDGFLQRPTAPANNPGVTLAAANTFRSVSPQPTHHGKPLPHAAQPLVPRSPAAGMAAFGRAHLLDESN